MEAGTIPKLKVAARDSLTCVIFCLFASTRGPAVTFWKKNAEVGEALPDGKKAAVLFGPENQSACLNSWSWVISGVAGEGWVGWEREEGGSWMLIGRGGAGAWTVTFSVIFFGSEMASRIILMISDALIDKRRGLWVAARKIIEENLVGLTQISSATCDLVKHIERSRLLISQCCLPFKQYCQYFHLFPRPG